MHSVSSFVSRTRNRRPHAELVELPAAPELHIVGAGPAGVLLALRAAQRGFQVHLYDPAGLQVWDATYGIIDSATIPAWCSPYCTAPFAISAMGSSLLFDYQMLDNAALVSACRQVVEVHRMEVDPVALSQRLGQRVVDCRGALTDGALWQVAVGYVLDCDHDPVFMDWAPTGEQPTFLYVQPHRRGTLFEETLLVTGQDMRSPTIREELFASLERQLSVRLAMLGIEPSAADIVEVERVCIPMGTCARPIGRVIPFGARAGFIHPATGYSLGMAMAKADDCLDAVLGGRAFSRSLNARVAFRLRKLGGLLIARADAETLRDFFQHFFALPVDRQVAYLQGDDGVAVARTMWALRSHTGLRHGFLRPLWRNPWRLLRASLR